MSASNAATSGPTPQASGKYRCLVCRDTGYYGDHGPGIKGNYEYVACDQCPPLPIEASGNESIIEHVLLSVTVRSNHEGAGQFDDSCARAVEQALREYHGVEAIEAKVLYEHTKIEVHPNGCECHKCTFKTFDFSDALEQGSREEKDAEIARLREELKKAQIPICIGKPIIQILAKEGQWMSMNGGGVVAADCLFRKDPYKDSDRLAEELREARADIEEGNAKGSNQLRLLALIQAERDALKIKLTESELARERMQRQVEKIWCRVSTVLEEGTSDARAEMEEVEAMFKDAAESVQPSDTLEKVREKLVIIERNDPGLVGLLAQEALALLGGKPI